MTTTVVTIDEQQGYWNAIREAAAALNSGGLVIFPTETVYGVAARADLPDALSRLYSLKQRPGEQPFTVHIAKKSDADDYAPDASPIARRLMRKCWPGPLTLILTTESPESTPIAERHGPDFAKIIYHNGTVGLRCPDFTAATDFLAAAEGPVVAASANLAGKPPPRSAEAALNDLDGNVDFCLDGGESRYSKASTIVRVDDQGYEILREGTLDQRMLDACAMMTILFVCTGNTCRSPMAEGLARKIFAEKIGCHPNDLGGRNIRIMSAGVAARPSGSPADHAVEVLSGRDIDISNHRTHALSQELIQSADHIFTMTESHRSTVSSMAPSAAHKTETLILGEDVSDPIGGDQDVYTACADMIEKALKVRLSAIEL